MFFLGTFDYAMDERGRVPLPPRYRDAYRGGIVLSQGSPNPCIRVYTQDEFARQAVQYTRQPAMTRSGHDMRLALFSQSAQVELDKQNRVLVPQHMREYAGLGGKVLVVGVGEWLELWSPETYADKMDRVHVNLPETLESSAARPEA